MTINIRSEGDGDCFLVTGSIGPYFRPKLFKNSNDAMRYAKNIEYFGEAEKIWPPFTVVIEKRFCEDMKMEIL